MNPFLKIAQFAFECHHTELSRVFTINKRTYQVCFQCGKEVDYSWELMRPQEAIVTPNRLAMLEREMRIRVRV